MPGRSLIGFAFLVFIISCSDKPKSMAGDEEVEISDFIAFFPEKKFPIRVEDTSLAGRLNDSLRIGEKVLTRFIPDSVWKQHFGKKTKPVFHAWARCREKEEEFYLIFTASDKDRRIAFLAVFDKKEKFIHAMPLVRSGFERGYHSYGTLDRKFQITTYKEKQSGMELQFKRNVYIFNREDGQFLLIMTEPNEEMIETVIDPIDTFPRLQKYSGNYVLDKRNFISIRDGKNAKEALFFIHFEKDNGSCTGELKGIARWVDKRKAQYQEPGNPCSIEFNFGTTSLSIRETGGCGTYRDIKCFFEGSYPKKYLPPPKAKSSGKK
jgi:hypothetical protein